MMQFRLLLSWREDLSALAGEIDQDVSPFLRDATEDWLKKARTVW